MQFRVQNEKIMFSEFGRSTGESCEFSILWIDAGANRLLINRPWRRVRWRCHGLHLLRVDGARPVGTDGPPHRRRLGAGGRAGLLAVQPAAEKRRPVRMPFQGYR